MRSSPPWSDPRSRSPQAVSPSTSGSPTTWPPRSVTSSASASGPSGPAASSTHARPLFGSPPSSPPPAPAPTPASPRPGPASRGRAPVATGILASRSISRSFATSTRPGGRHTRGPRRPSSTSLRGRRSGPPTGAPARPSVCLRTELTPGSPACSPPWLQRPWGSGPSRSPSAPPPPPSPPPTSPASSSGSGSCSWARRCCSWPCSSRSRASRAAWSCRRSPPWASAAAARPRRCSARGCSWRPSARSSGPVSASVSPGR